METYRKQILRARVRIIREALEAAGGCRTEAATLLSLQRTHLLRLMRDFNLQDGQGRPGGTCPHPNHAHKRRKR